MVSKKNLLKAANWQVFGDRHVRSSVLSSVGYGLQAPQEIGRTHRDFRIKPRGLDDEATKGMHDKTSVPERKKDVYQGNVENVSLKE